MRQSVARSPRCCKLTRFLGCIPSQVGRSDPYIDIYRHGISQYVSSLESTNRLAMCITAHSLAVAYLTADGVGLATQRSPECDDQVSGSGYAVQIYPINVSSESNSQILYQSNYHVRSFRLPELIDILFSIPSNWTESLKRSRPKSAQIRIECQLNSFNDIIMQQIGSNVVKESMEYDR
jgi:hypothetical protein